MAARRAFWDAASMGLKRTGSCRKLKGEGQVLGISKVFGGGCGQMGGQRAEKTADCHLSSHLAHRHNLELPLPSCFLCRSG